MYWNPGSYLFTINFRNVSPEFIKDGEGPEKEIESHDGTGF